MSLYAWADIIVWAVFIGCLAGAALGTFLFFCLRWLEQKGIIRIE
jgi:NhaP-type Na+/H+ or K+/H+ antiporter